MRRKEERSKQGQINNKVKNNTAHPRQSLFLRKMSCLGWDSNMYTESTEGERVYIYRDIVHPATVEVVGLSNQHSIHTEEMYND